MVELFNSKNLWTDGAKNSFAGVLTSEKLLDWSWIHS